MGKFKPPKENENPAEKMAQECPHQVSGAQEGTPSIQTLPETLRLHLDKVLEATTASREALEQKLETVVVDLALLRADPRKIA